MLRKSALYCQHCSQAKTPLMVVALHSSAQHRSTHLSVKASLNSGTWDSSLEELFPGVHEDVLVPCQDLDPLSDLPDEGFCGGRHHINGELVQLSTMVEATVPCPGRLSSSFSSSLGTVEGPRYLQVIHWTALVCHMSCWADKVVLILKWSSPRVGA